MAGAWGYWIARGVGRTMETLGEFLDVALGCAGVFGGHFRLGVRWKLPVSFLMWRSAGLESRVRISFLRGGEGRKTLAPRWLRLDPRQTWAWGRVAHQTGGHIAFSLSEITWWAEGSAGKLGFWIAHGVGRTMDSLSEFPDVALGCAGVSGTTSSWIVGT